MRKFCLQFYLIKNNLRLHKTKLILKKYNNQISCSVTRKKHNKMQQQQIGSNSNGSSSNSNKTTQRLLAAFDFDYTVVAQNTDTVVRDMLPPDKLSKSLNDIIDAAGWTEYMAAVFRLLHEHNFTAAQIRDKVRCIPEVPGFVRLLKRLQQRGNCDIIIISDANSIFIAEWLKAHHLNDCITAIFTNPAEFNSTGLLEIQPYHHQTDCRLSAANLCKGKVLEHFMVDQNLRYNYQYERVIYIGDGNNDICPVLRLRSADIACARLGFALEKSLTKNRDKLKLHAELIIWKNGFELLEQLEEALK